jgi:hypothetical protein
MKSWLMEEVMGTPLTVGPAPLGVMEPLIYVLASAIASRPHVWPAFLAARAARLDPTRTLRQE